jgi:hypothetical protein
MEIGHYTDLRQMDCDVESCLMTVCNINPLNAELNPIRHLLALVGAAILSTLAG